VLMLAGCGTTTEKSGTSHATAAMTDQYAAPSALKPAKPWYRKGKHWSGFQSPTGNIRCGPNSNDPTELLCETLSNRDGATLELTGPVDTSWRITIGAGWPTLRYGKHWSSRYFWCDSEFDGTYCRSLYSHQGFLIDRDGIQRYVWKTVPLHLGSAGGGYTGDSGSGNGYPVTCVDGTISYSGGIQGACSSHGGIAGGSSGYGTGGSGGGYTIPGGTGYQVMCNDGTFSNSGGIQGACSWHGGVAGSP
jgi:hypothetical protein